MLTAGVDVQKDRLEAEIVAWGKNRESWSIDYQVFEGDPGGDTVLLVNKKIIKISQVAS